MIITKKEFKILKSNKTNELQKRKISRKIEKKNKNIKIIIIILFFILAFVIVGNMEYKDQQSYLNLCNEIYLDTTFLNN